MLSGRDHMLVAKGKQVAGVDDFELVTGLVIKAERDPA